MPQPSGQALLDPARPNHAARSFWYCDGASLWDAKAGATLAKTGTAGTAVEGGANVVLGNGSTYYALASALALSGDFTIQARARLTSSSTNSMLFGSRSNNNNFFWLAADGTNATVRIASSNQSYIRGDVTVWATYTIVRSGTSVSVYRDSSLIATKAIAGTFDITHILSGYTGTSFIANGALEFLHIMAGVALDATGVASYVADPYQDLAAPAGDTTAPVLSAASVGASSGTAGTGGVTTTEAGPAWAVLTTSSATPTSAQIKSGQDHAGASASATATVTLNAGANASAFAFAGLTPGGTYYLHVTQDDTASPANTATPITSSPMTTPAPDATLPVLTGSIALVSKSETTISVTCPAGSDNVAVVAYEWSLDGGSTWADDDTSRDFTGLSTSTAYAIRARARDAAGNRSTPALELSVTTDAAPAGTITLTSPTPYQSRQRSIPGNTAPLTVSGTYTGSPASIQYRFAGGTWATLIASPSGGTFSVAVTLATGQGAFEVRFSNDTGVTASAAYVTVGDGYIVGGQSNHAGRAAAVVAPVPTNFVVTKLRRNGEWKQLTEAVSGADTFDEGVGASASYFGALSNRLQSVGVPVFFMPCAEGSTSINDWARYDPDPANPYFLYGDMLVADQRAGGHRAVLWLQGETDAANGMSQATYETQLNELVDDWHADTGKPFFVIQIVRWSAGIYGQIDAIRAAQAAVAASNPRVVGVVDGNVWQSANDVHYQTATHINALADVVSAGMVTAFYTARTPVDSTVTLARSVRTYTTGTSAVARSVRAFASGAAGLARSVRGFASAIASVARSIAASGVATTTLDLARSVRVHVNASAVVVRSISAAGVVTATTTIARRIGGYITATALLRRSIGETVPIAWPTTQAGHTHRAVVPFTGVRAVVPAGDPAMIKTFVKQPIDVEVYVIDWAEKYLEGTGDIAGNLLSITSDVGVSVTTNPAVGQPVLGGVLLVRVAGGTAGQTYKITARMATAGGREKEAEIEVKVLEI